MILISNILKFSALLKFAYILNVAILLSLEKKIKTTQKQCFNKCLEKKTILNICKTSRNLYRVEKRTKNNPTYCISLHIYNQH